MTIKCSFCDTLVVSNPMVCPNCGNDTSFKVTMGAVPGPCSLFNPQIGKPDSCVCGWRRASHPQGETYAERFGEKNTNPKDAIGSMKAPLHLLSPIAELHWAHAQFVGNVKYGAWNFRAGGARVSVYIAAAKRHLAAYISGEEFDPVDGTHHLGNVMACMAIIFEAQACGKLTDDRPPSVTHRRALEYVEGQMKRVVEQYRDKDPRHFTIDDTEELNLPRAV